MPEDIEVETDRLREQVDEAREEHERSAPWVRYVGLGAAFFAVIAAVAALRSGDLINEALIAQIKASDTWNEYQASREKQHIYTVGADQSADRGGKSSRVSAYHAEIAKEVAKQKPLAETALEAGRGIGGGGLAAITLSSTPSGCCRSPSRLGCGRGARALEVCVVPQPRGGGNRLRLLPQRIHPVKLLEGKRALVTGVANRWSIATGIARKLHEYGALVALTYQGERVKGEVEKLASELGNAPAVECDVSNDASLAEMRNELERRFGKLDVLVHSIAYANKEDLAGKVFDTSRAGFSLALDVSSYSLIALVQALRESFNDGASIMALTYLGATQIVPNW